MAQLITTLGPIGTEDLGITLPHEHVFADLRTWNQHGYAQADPAEVVTVMAPELEGARNAGIGAIVEASTVGVGRRADILKAVSAAAGFPLVIPTGVYREPWVPNWVQVASEDDLREWMTNELEGQIEDSGVRAGWIKLSAGDNGITETEAKILRAAAGAGAATNAVIGSHTIRGRVVRDQLAIIEEVGHAPTRFVWIHAQAEPDFDLHLEMAARGVWIEYDDIGSTPDSIHIDRIKRLLDAGHGGQILLSQDRGFYDPGQPGGSVPRPFTYLTETFLPALAAVGVDDAAIRRMTRENPFRAFAR